MPNASRTTLSIALLVALTVLIRLPALVHPRAIDDESVYALVANEIVEGGRPYVDAIERKPPLLFWTYAAIFGVAGELNWRALHAVAVAWTLLTMAGLYRLAGGLFGRRAGLLAGALYCVYQPWATWKNLAFNGELLMNLPLLWSWAIAFAPSRHRFRPELLVSGALACAAFLLKQPAAIAAVPLGLYLLLPSYRASRGCTLRESWIHASCLVAGFFGALAAVVLVLREQGILREAFYWTITDHDLPHVFWSKAVLMSLAFTGACLPMVLGAALSLGDKHMWQGKHAERSALAGLLAASAVGAAAGGRFYPHYYLQLLPSLAALAGAYFGALDMGLSTPPRWLPGQRVISAWVALTVVAFSASHWHGLASQRSTIAGRYLLEHAHPKDRIFVWGQSASVYLDAHLRPASRYITTFPLTGYVFGGVIRGLDTRSRILPGAWDNLRRDFARHPPVFIVDTEAAPDARYPIERFPVLANLVATDFEPLTGGAQDVVYGRRGRARPVGMR